MKKSLFLFAISIAFIVLASPVKSNAQAIVYTAKYFICEKVDANNMQTLPSHVILRKRVINPDIDINKSDYIPNPPCLDYYPPLPNQPKKKPIRQEK